MFSLLDNYTLDHIISFVGSPYLLTNLRLTCKRMAQNIPPPKKITPNRLLKEAALEGKIVVCILAKERGAEDWNTMLESAACGGHKDICHLAKEWGATDWNQMLVYATYGGHKELCFLAKEWGATDWNRMLFAAVKDGRKDLLLLAEEWGTTDWNRSRRRATNWMRNISSSCEIQ
jgi:hypothetical protein